MGVYLDDFNDKLKITHYNDYYRHQYQSFMTGPEWRNVEMSEEFAQFLKDGNPYFSFPFFRQTFGLWRIFWNSFRASLKYDSFGKVATSEYMLMDLFVCIFTTMEMLPKGIFSLFLWPFLSKTNQTEMQQHIAKATSKYACDLQTVPFYNHDYESMRKDLAEKYKQCQSISWGDWFSWTYMSVEFRARKWISKPLQWIYSSKPEGADNQDEAPVSQEPSVTDVIVKLKLKGRISKDNAKQVMSKKIAKIDGIEIVDKLIYVKNSGGKSDNTSVYACVRTPRYKKFVEVVKKLQSEDIHLRLIAGQTHVQVKCVVQANDKNSLVKRTESTRRLSGTNCLYSYGDCLNASRQILMFDAPVKNLEETLDKLETQNGTRVEFIHNF